MSESLSSAGAESLAHTPSPSLAAIIPAFNETGRIGRVLAVLRDVAELGEIIVVDDGSTDGTQAEVEAVAAADPRIRCLRFPANRGKGEALFAGARATSADILLFLDADLVGLKPDHVRALIRPVSEGQAELSIGIFQGGQLNTDFAHWLTPWLSGQRCLPAHLFAQVRQPTGSGYGIETAITLTARRERWRCQNVPWRGVSHVPAEFRRGLWPGVQNRLRMYGAIFRTLFGEKVWQLFVPSLSMQTRLKLVLGLILVSSSFAYDRAVVVPNMRLDDVPYLSLADIERVLVIAPHPDDETLGAGGAIQLALAGGAEVKVVVVTNGDGQAVAPLVLRHQFLARSADYIITGEERQVETLAAMKALGLPAGSVVFLGYPDGQLRRLWLNDWTTACPLQARYTKVTYSPYLETFNPLATYCGRDLLDDLQTIILNYEPDLVLLPHPNDEHPDHLTTSNFARMALALATEADPEYRPEAWGYLVHYGFYPQPRGLHSQNTLLPPSPLSSAGNGWARLDLTPEQVRAKAAAIQAHASQVRLLGSFMPAFARRNEIFAYLRPLDIRPLAYVDFPVNEEGVIETPKMPEPADESTRRRVLGGADLVGLQLARLDNQLWLTAETRRPLFPGLRYRLLVKLPSGETLTADWPGSATRTGPASFTMQLNLDEIGDPDVMGFAADVQQGATLDRTGWHFAILRDGLP